MFAFLNPMHLLVLHSSIKIVLNYYSYETNRSDEGFPSSEDAQVAAWLLQSEYTCEVVHFLTLGLPQVQDKESY
jgi:hypothetical protein